MREIKFNAWDVKEKKMHTGITLNSYHGYDDYGPASWETDQGPLLEGKNREIIWLQYTGLKDKNGKEIYDGYIAKSGWNEKVFQVAWVEELSWDSGGSVHPGFYFKDLAGREINELIYGLDLHGCEIIGNIFQNPELLEEAK